MPHHLTALAAVALITASAAAQSLNERPVPTAPASSTDPAGGSSSAPATSAAALQGVSLFMVTPPPPRKYQKNDLVEIIVNESSQQTSEQSLDTKKDYSTKAELSRFPSLRHLLELQLRDGDSSPVVGVGASSQNKFKGEGDYQRKDKFQARISAVVIEVKPNGTLLLEARKNVKSNTEETTLVLSGLARPDDISNANTIQSSQLANLTLTTKSEGDVNATAKKGIIPQVLDTIFNF